MLIFVNFLGRKFLEEILWEKLLGREKLNQKLLGETFFLSWSHPFLQMLVRPFTEHLVLALSEVVLSEQT